MKKVLPLLFLFLFFGTSKIYAESIYINEFLVHPGTNGKEWVEFYTSGKTDLANYWIDDDADFLSDSGSSAKKQLISVNPANPEFPFFELTSSIFNNTGDSIVLFSPEGDIVDQYQYESDPGIDFSIGRFPDSADEFVFLTSSSKGGSNNSSYNPTAFPTKIPTSNPTQRPTNTPAPTATKTPTKVPTKSPTNKPTQRPTVSPKAKDPVQEKDASSPDKREILGVSTKPTEVKKETKILGASSNPVPLIFIGLGVIMLVVCGILAYVSFKKNSESN